MTTFRAVMEWVGLVFDAAGVVVIAGGALFAARHFFVGFSASKAIDIRRFRQDFGGAIVLGLEFFVAGDIIRTVVVAPTLENVAVLAIIVLIRTVLSMGLQVEIEGHWPWQPSEATPQGQAKLAPLMCSRPGLGEHHGSVEDGTVSSISACGSNAMPGNPGTGGSNPTSSK